MLPGDWEVVYTDAGYQDIPKRPDMEDNTTKSRVVMRHGKSHALPDTP
jgi:hypothetical protein